MEQAAKQAAIEGPGAVRATLAGLCASLVGIGLARFAYTPLIPALIANGWFTPADAAYLGAANLAGYLAGALLARYLAAWIPAGMLLRTMMLLAAASFFACAAPLHFAWFFLWRFASGLAGGILMVVAAPTALVRIEAGRRGLAGGIIFTGVGLGIVASGTIVPPLLRQGLTPAWLGLGAVALLLTMLAWHGWPRVAPASAPQVDGTIARPRHLRAGLWTLCAAYALNAAGLVPHMVFLVDFVARGLDRGIEAGAAAWVLFGLGATAGPVLGGLVADRIGFGRTLRLAFLIQAGAIVVPVLATGAGSIAVSSLVVGAFVPGVVPLVLGRVHELIPTDGPERRAAWSFITAAFALGQAAGAYAFSFLYSRTSDFPLLFALGSGLLIAALLLEMLLGRTASRRR
jgi:predicted MFS family arabinose efflux permease